MQAEEKAASGLVNFSNLSQMFRLMISGKVALPLLIVSSTLDETFRDVKYSMEDFCQGL